MISQVGQMTGIKPCNHALIRALRSTNPWLLFKLLNTFKQFKTLKDTAALQLQRGGVVVMD
jgi:hypothetical protein